MPNKTKQNTKNSTEQICSQPLYKSQTTHHTQPTPKKKTPPGWLRRQPPPTRAADAHTVLNVNPTVCLSAKRTFMPNPNTHPHPPPTLGSEHMQAQENKQHNTRQNTCRRLTVRCSRPLYSSQPTHPHPPKTPKNGNPGRVRQPGRTAPEPRQHATPTPRRDTHQPADHHDHNSRSSPPPGGRVSYASTRQPTPPQHPPHRQDTRAPASHPAFRGQQPPGRPGPNYTAQTRSNDQEATPTQPILRKEVIQPHLPVRLPCYDFVPITSPTFDRSP